MFLLGRVYNGYMAWDEYIGLVDMSALRTVPALKGMSQASVYRAAGISMSHWGNMIHGRFIPPTETVAKICAALQCSVDEIIKFNGIEVKDTFKKIDPFVEHTPDTTGTYAVSYEPLRNLIMSHYGNRMYKQKMDELLQKIPLVGGTEKQKANMELRQEVRRKEIAERGTTGTGIPPKVRSMMLRFKTDKPINMRYVYNLCKVLGCTPAWIMTYR